MEPGQRPAVTAATAPLTRVRFGEFEVDLRARELYRRDPDGAADRVPLQDRPFEVLAALLERPGEVVLRQELQDRLWPGQIVEFDNNLNTALTKLRRALDDTTDEPTIIETLPKRGYRLLVPVEPVPAPAALPTAGPERPHNRLTKWVILGVLAFGAVWLGVGRVREDASPAETAAPEAPVRTALLVVLPFGTTDPDGGDDRLADALTEELIHRLAEALPSELGVIARTSAMTLKNAGADIAAVRATLGVDYVLEGSVSRHDTGLQVRVSFISAADQAHLWAESWTATLDEMPRVQHSIAERIAAGVSTELRSSGTLTAAEPVAPDAWEAYLQARYLMTAELSPSASDIAEAIALLERAVGIAPDFALAWASLADAVYWQAGPPSERHPRAREAAERALALDPGLSLPHHRLANLALYHDWDWEAASREFDQAIALAPNLAVNHHSRAAWYSTQGRHDEALASIDRAMALDPLSVVLHADAGWYLYVARRYEDAVARTRQAIELVPGHRGANSYLFHSLMALGRTEEAAQVARTLLEIEEAPDELRTAALDSPDAAIETLRRFRLAVLEADHAEGTASPGRLALAHLELGHTDEALTYLGAGLDDRWGWIYPFLAVYPLLDPLAGETRFQELLDAVAVPPERLVTADSGQPRIRN